MSGFEYQRIVEASILITSQWAITSCIRDFSAMSVST